MHGKTLIREFALITLASVMFFAVSCTSVENAGKPVELRVSGSGKISLAADIVTFQIQVSETEETTFIAQQTANEKTGMIFSVLRSFGIQDSDISTTAFNFYSDYRWDSELQKQVKVGECVSQTVSVKVRNIDDFAKIIDTIGSCVSGISLNSVNFSAENNSVAQQQAREAAYLDAYQKAEAYAKAAGFSVITPVSITDGYASVSNRSNFDSIMYASAKAESFSTEIPVGDLCITANTEVVFNLY